MNDYTSKIVELQDENLKIDKIEFEDDLTNIFVSFKQLPIDTACPECGSAHFHVHAYSTRKIKHSLIVGKPSIVYLTQPRLICMEEECNRTFNPPCNLASSNRRLSNPLLSNIKASLQTKRSFKDVAATYGISDTIVTDEFRLRLHNYRCSLTEVICVDEFKADTEYGVYAFVIGDPVSGKILDVLPARTQDYLNYYFQTLSKVEIDKVKYIVSDLFGPFRTVIQEIFPKAIHIADRFHWIRLCAEAFNAQRIREMNFYKKSVKTENNSEIKSNYIKYSNLLEHNKKILLMNKATQPAWKFDQIIKKENDISITIQKQIEICTNISFSLEEGYSLLQELYRIAKFSNELNAKENIRNWCNKVKNSQYILPEMRKVALTYLNWINEISNSFIISPTTHQRMASGFIEGKNNYIKVVKRIAFGFKDFDLFRDRIISLNNYDVENKQK